MIWGTPIFIQEYAQFWKVSHARACACLNFEQLFVNQKVTNKMTIHQSIIHHPTINTYIIYMESYTERVYMEVLRRRVVRDPLMATSHPQTAPRMNPFLIYICIESYIERVHGGAQMEGG